MDDRQTRHGGTAGTGTDGVTSRDLCGAIVALLARGYPAPGDGEAIQAAVALLGECGEIVLDARRYADPADPTNTGAVISCEIDGVTASTWQSDDGRQQRDCTCGDASPEQACPHLWALWLSVHVQQTRDGRGAGAAWEPILIPRAPRRQRRAAERCRRRS